LFISLTRTSLIYQSSLLIVLLMESAMRNFLGAGAIFALLLTGIASIEAAPIAGEPVAIITNPWGGSSAIEVVAASGGALMRSGRWRFVAVAAADEDPAFHQRLRTAGAWLIVSPIRLGACLDDKLLKPSQAKRS
jgi:hypothetical protein